MWAQMEQVGEDLRPDKCGVIFSRQGEDVIAARVDADTLMTQLAVNQIDKFVEQGFSVAAFLEDKCKISLRPDHSIQHVIGAINDRALVYKRSH